MKFWKRANVNIKFFPLTFITQNLCYSLPINVKCVFDVKGLLKEYFNIGFGPFIITVIVTEFGYV